MYNLQSRLNPESCHTSDSMATKKRLTLNIERKTGSHRRAIPGRFMHHRAAREFGRHEEDQHCTIVCFVAKEITIEH